jgi:hypothetical protein
MFWNNKWLCSVTIMCILASLSCRDNKETSRRAISKQEALALAVTIANKECMERFSTSPFDSTSYPIEFKHGRWQWGAIDLAGANGYSGIVSFDAYGNNQRVEVFLSTDTVTPLNN